MTVCVFFYAEKLWEYTSLLDINDKKIISQKKKKNDDLK